jgi:hypothetical protein
VHQSTSRPQERARCRSAGRPGRRPAPVVEVVYGACCGGDTASRSGPCRIASAGSPVGKCARFELDRRRLVRRRHHRRRALRHVPGPSPARAGPERARVRGRYGRGRHLVLEPLSRRALRLRELDLRLLLLRRAAPRVGVERTLRGPARDAALLQLRGRQARPAPRHRVQQPDPGRGLRRGGGPVGGRGRGRSSGAGPLADHRHRAALGPHHAEHSGRRPTIPAPGRTTR